MDIVPSKEDPKLSEPKKKFDVYLCFACLKDDCAFEAMSRICDDFDAGLTQDSKTSKQRSNARMPIIWL